MKRLFLVLAVAVCGLLAVNAQTNNVIWLNGSAFVGAVNQVDSLNKATVEGADTLCLLLPRMVVERDTVTIAKTTYEYVFIRDTVKADTPDMPEGALSGAFSVSADKKVRFSKGNLQYTRSSQTWSFAEHQYDMIGTDNVTGGDVSIENNYGNVFGYQKTGTALADKIDLFGWSGSTGSAKWGVSASSDRDDYGGDFADWGTNIGDGKTWYTLSNDEWEYVLEERTNASKLQCAARINLNDEGTDTINGVILLPDDWTCPAGVTLKSGFAEESSMQAFADYQQISLSDWQQLENAGAVFFPATGYRNSGARVRFVQYQGLYWSATPKINDYPKDPDYPDLPSMPSETHSNDVFFNSGNATTFSQFRDSGLAVRLVTNVE